MRPTRHVYLDLPALTPQLQAYITASSQSGGWSNNCLQVRTAPGLGLSVCITECRCFSSAASLHIGSV